MKKNTTFVLISVFLAFILIASLVGCAPTPEAQPETPEEEVVVEYPKSTITIIVPWSPGGRSDIAARTYGPFLEKELGVPVVVANHPGGGGVIGARAVTQSAADGHTLGFFSISHIAAQWTKVPAFEFEDYIPVNRMFIAPITVTVHADSEWETLQDFIDYAKANPGAVRNGASGTGTSDHVLSAAFFKAAGIEVQNVPYEGDGPAVIAVANKEVEMTAVPMVSVKAQLDAGELKVLGVALEERSPLYPDVPTFAEQGIPYFGASFDGIYVTKGTPDYAVQALSAAFEKILRDPELLEITDRLFLETGYLPSSAFQAYLAEVNPVIGGVINELDLNISGKEVK